MRLRSSSRSCRRSTGSPSRSLHTRELVPSSIGRGLRTVDPNERCRLREPQLAALARALGVDADGLPLSTLRGQYLDNRRWLVKRHQELTPWRHRELTPESASVRWRAAGGRGCPSRA
jgi:hypothetical protein